MSAGSKFDARSDLAIAALLSTSSQAEAAAEAGISEATLTRWLREPEFQRRYREARWTVLHSAIGRLQALANQAVSTLAKNLTCGKPAAEIRAAQAVLKAAVDGCELMDLAERIRALEQQEPSRGVTSSTSGPPGAAGLPRPADDERGADGAAAVGEHPPA